MSTQAAEHGRPRDSFPLRLRIARFHAGDLSAKEAALLVGVSGQTWRNWEQGQYVDAARKPSMLRYIADQLDVNEAWLRDGGPLGDPGSDGGGAPMGSKGDTHHYLSPVAPLLPDFARPWPVEDLLLTNEAA